MALTVEAKKYDLSKEKDGSVEMWLTKNEIGFNLHIGGKGVVEAPEDSSYLFSEYKNLERIILKKF